MRARLVFQNVYFFYAFLATFHTTAVENEGHRKSFGSQLLPCKLYRTLSKQTLI